MELSFFFDTELKFSAGVTEHEFLLRCLPAELPEQEILSHTFTILPEDAKTSFGTDAFGNCFCSGRLEREHDRFRYTLQGKARRDDALLEKSEEAAPFYRYPSPLTQPTEELGDFLKDIVPERGGALEIAGILSDSVHEHFIYAPGETGISTTAGEAFRRARGVCQDYAHVFITLCRMAGIPARYVSGLPVGEGASHAWAEVWADGIWHGFDPTRHTLAGESYLKLCVGRDYSDCPIERGVFLGGADQTQTVFMKVTNN